MTDSEIIELLKQQNDFLQKMVQSLNQNIQSQTETIEKLTEEIAELKEKLHKDSHNSSKPPSSDGYSLTRRRRETPENCDSLSHFCRGILREIKYLFQFFFNASIIYCQ